MRRYFARALAGAAGLGLLAGPALASDVPTRKVRCYGLDSVETQRERDKARETPAQAADAADRDRAEPKEKTRRKTYKSLTTSQCAAAGGSLREAIR